MNKVGKSWNLEKIPDGYIENFFVKKLWAFESISNKWNFQTLEKVGKKVRKVAKIRFSKKLQNSIFTILI